MKDVGNVEECGGMEEDLRNLEMWRCGDVAVL
jgi:hypothetical protein